MRDVRFFGDVDWLENGGVFIGKAYSEEEEKAYPALKSSYQVFRVFQVDDKGPYASLCQINVDNWRSVYENLGSDLNDPYQCILDLVECHGTCTFSDSSYSCQYPNSLSDYSISLSNLLNWMCNIGLESYAAKYIGEIAYERYRKVWFHDHITVNRLNCTKEAYREYVKECEEWNSIPDSFAEYVEDNGFYGGELWVCYDEFLGVEYMDSSFMQSILNEAEWKAYEIDIKNMEVA